MIHRLTQTACAASLLAASVLSAQQPDPSAAPDLDAILRDPTTEEELRLFEVPGLEGEPARMSLRDVVLTTLAYNLDLQSTGIDRDIAAEQVFAEYGFYDPEFAAEFAYSHSDEQNAPGSRTTNEDHTWSTTASLTQRTGFGSALFVEATDIKVDTEEGGTGAPAASTSTSGASTFMLSETNYRDSVTFGVRQPLLKNFGRDVNNLNLRVSKRELDIANYQFRQALQDRVGDVMRAYWELVFAIQQLDVDNQSLISARELERVQDARVRVGLLPRLELVQAQAQVAQREFLVAASQQAVTAAQDQLLALMNWNREGGGEAWNRPILPVDRPTTIEDLDLRDGDLILFAQDFRPDFQIAQVNREIADLRRRAARRQLLPELSAFAEYTTTGFDNSRGDAIDTLYDEYNGWSAGLAFRYPLFNRQARGLYAQTEDRVEQAEVLLDSTELLITTEVRGATRALRTTLTQVEAARRGVQSELERVQAERQRLEVGERTVFNVLDALDDLAEAQSNLVRALADFQIALIDLGRATGTILWAQGIAVEDQGEPGLFTISFTPDEGPRTLASEQAMMWGDLVRGTPNIRTGGDANPVPSDAREAAAPQANDVVRP